MIARTAVAALATIAMLVIVTPASAEPARFPVMLPNCPTPLVLSAPAEFAGAANEQHVLDHFASNPARKGTYVLSITAPAKPELHLLVLELGTTKSIQGGVTQQQFDELSAYLQNQDLAVLARNQEYANELNAGRKTKIEIKGTNYYKVSANNRETVLLAIGHSAAEQTEHVNYLGLKFLYAQNCIAQVNMFAPVGSMSIEDFEALVPFVSMQ